MTHLFQKIIHSCCVALTLATIHAQGNLVRNGGFEQLISDWQGTHGTQEGVDYAFEGTVVAIVMDRGSSSINKTMYQLLSTEPMAPYVLRFSLLAPNGRVGEIGGPAPVEVRWGGTNIAQVRNASATTWRTFEYELVAQSSITELNFESLGRNPSFIDGISVTAVPEPSSAILFASALVAVIVRRRGA
jgi:hypothetical protein